MPNTSPETSELSKQDFVEEDEKSLETKEIEIEIKTREDRIQDDFVNKESFEDNVSANENLDDKSFAFLTFRDPKKNQKKK